MRKSYLEIFLEQKYSEKFPQVPYTASDLVQWREQNVFRAIKGIKRLTLGFCGNSSYKTLDEMIKVLITVNLASSANEAKELLTREDVFGTLGNQYLILEDAQGAPKNQVYKVSLAPDSGFGYAD